MIEHPADIARRWRRDRLRAGERLRAVRTAAGLTQHVLAVRSGIGYALISKYERGHVAPETATIRALADALAVDPMTFVSDADGNLVPFADPVIWFGEAGCLTTNAAGELQCHLCGVFVVLLGRHARDRHGLTAREYRAIAGLKYRTSLVSATKQRDYRARGKARVATPAHARLRAGQAAYLARTAAEPTPRSREISLEARNDPHRQAAMTANAAKARAARAHAPAAASHEATAPRRRESVPYRERLAQGHAIRRTWGAGLRACRQASGLSGADLARAIAISPSTISRLETGTIGPTDAIYTKLKTVLPDLPDQPPSVRSFQMAGAPDHAGSHRNRSSPDEA